MQKKSKTILTAVLTALFVLSVSYFALLAPTTAWYYQKEDKSYDFTFGNFNMTNVLQSGEEQDLDFTFRGTTRFADAGEELFDEMLHIIKVTATNSGDSNGSVRITVKQEIEDDEIVELPLDNEEGLRWFIFEPDANATVKSKIDDMLTAWNPAWPIDYNTLTSQDNVTFTEYNQMNGEAESAYEKYNAGETVNGEYTAGAIDALKEYNKRGVTVPSGSTKSIYIAFWVEYGAAKTALDVGSSAVERDTTIPSLVFEDLMIRIDAMPDIGGTGTTKLQLNNGASASVNVKLYRWTDGWTLYKDEANTDSDGVILLAANGSKLIDGLQVGTRFKVELVVPENTTPTVHFAASAAQEVNDDGTAITGALFNGVMDNDTMIYAENIVSIAANT